MLNSTHYPADTDNEKNEDCQDKQALLSYCQSENIFSNHLSVDRKIIHMTYCDENMIVMLVALGKVQA